MKRLIISSVALMVLASSIAIVNSQNFVDSESLLPVGWNESEKENIDGTKTSEFHLKMINFVDSNGKWKKSDLSLKRDNNGFHIKDAPYAVDIPLKANGDIKFIATNRYDIKEKKIRDDAPIYSLKKFINAIPVDGQETNDGVLYPGALPDIDADLLLQPHEMEMRYLVVWNSLPRQCADSNNTFKIPFTQSFDNGLLPRRSENNARIKTVKEKFRNGFRVDASSFRGIGIPVAHIWDSSGKREIIEIEGKFNNGVLDGAKVINCSFFAGSVYPIKTDTTTTFFPDPSVEVTSVDGFSGHNARSDVSWATARSAAGNLSDDSSTTLTLTQMRQDGTYTDVIRGFALFDTSSITSAGTISSAVLSVYGSSKSNTWAISPDINVFSASPASNTAIANADKTTVGTTAYCDTAISYASFNTAGYNDFTFNATGIAAISKTGVSKFSIYNQQYDANNSAPTISGGTSSANIIAISADTAGTSTDPKLVVTYTVPSTSSPVIILVSFVRKLIPRAFAQTF